MKNKILSYLLAIILGIAVFAPQTSASSKNISFEIQLHGWAISDSKTYKIEQPISIHCVWKNIGNQPCSLFLKDHDSYHGTLDYPIGISAKVIDNNGKVLTQSNHGEWWSWYYLWSTLFKEMPGDVITLKPGEEVIRIVPLDVILRGLEAIPEGLTEGTYKVTLKYGELISNQLEIKLIKE